MLQIFCIQSQFFKLNKLLTLKYALLSYKSSIIRIRNVKVS